MIVVSQTPLGVLLGTIPQASAQLDLSAITTVTVTGPTAWAYSNTINVTWTTNVDPENVDISYCQGSQCTIENWTLTPIVLAESNDGSYSWDTSSIPNGTGYKIVIARAGFQSPLGLSAAFEIYNASYDNTEDRDVVGIGFPDPSPIWTDVATYLTTYITNTVTRSSFAWTQQSGSGTLSFSSTTGDTTTVSADQDGSYVIRFTATDYAGNTVYDDVTFHRDTTGPTASDNISPGWYYYDADVTLYCDDGIGTGCDTIYYTTNGSNPSVETSNSVASGSSFNINGEWTYTVKYMAVDFFGNTGAIYSGTVNIYEDWYTYINDNSGDYGYYKNQFTVDGYTSDGPDSGVASRLWTQTGGPGTITFGSNSSSSTTVSASEDGYYTIQYTVNANDVWEGSDSDSFSFYWDTIMPTSSANVATGRQTSSTTVSFNCNDTWTGASGCERIWYRSYKVGRDDWSNWNYLDINDEDFELDFDEDGDYTVNYYAVDRAGNEEGGGQNWEYNSFTVLVDTIDPSISFDMAWDDTDPDTIYTSQTITGSATTSDSTSGIASCVWSVSNGSGDNISFGSPTSCSSTTIDANTNGLYTIRLTVTDNAGNSNYDEFDLYWDTNTPVIENLNVTVESSSEIAVAWLARSATGLYLSTDIYLVQYYIDGEGASFLAGELSVDNMYNDDPQLFSFSGSIDISSLSNGTHTLTVVAYNQADTASQVASQSFNKISGSAQIYGPTVISSTPSNAATYVSVAPGTATITFNQNIDFACHYNGECNSVNIKKLSNDASVVSGGEAGVSWTGNVLSIEYNELEYNTNYVIQIPAYSVAGTNRSWNTQDTFIYFTTQVGTAPDITGLGVENVGATDAYIVYSTDPETPDSRQYRISTTAYSGTWYASTNSPQSIGSLAPNTTYYYQVKFVNNGHTVVSVPMSFKTAAAEDGIIVNNIARVLNNVDPVVGGNYSNGYHFRFYLTINDLWEDRLEFKLANWARTDGGTMAVANNTKVIVSEQGTGNYNATGTTLTNTSYTTIGNVWNIDADQNLGGRQLYLDLFYKIPTGSQGVYTTSFGIQSSNRCIGNDGWPVILESWQTAC